MLLASGLQAQVSPSWETTLNGKGDFGDRLNTVVTGPDNAIYAAGFTVNPNTDRDFLVIKYNAQAQVQWRRIFAAPGNGPDEAKKILLHPNGNIVVTGYGNNRAVGNDFFTIMLKPDGDTVWTKLYNSPVTNLYDEPNGMAIDNQGNIIITGESDQDPTIFLNNDFLTVKYNSSGILQWAARFNGIASDNDRAIGVTVDIGNNIYVTGRSFNGNDDDYVTIKYNPEGAEQWREIFDNGDTDRPVAIGTDAAGRVYVTGRSGNGTDDDYRTIQYNSNGVLQFNVLYDNVGHDRPADMVVMNEGGCMITGRSDANPTGGINYDIFTIAYSASGVTQWSARYNGSAGNDDAPVSIGLTADKKTLVTGFSDQDPGVNISNDLVVLSYSTAGTSLITQTFNGQGFQDDEGESVAALNDGKIVVAGFTSTAAKQTDALLLIYNDNSSPVAQHIWTGKGDNGENIRQIATDASGNVYFCGYTVSKDQSRNFLLGKMNNSGQIQWLSDTTGSLYGSDEEANAMALDGFGNVYVSGYLKNSGKGSDIYLTKFSSSGNRIWEFIYDSPINESDRSYAMTLDNAGNVYLAGKTDVDPSWQVNEDLLVIKVNSNGTLAWKTAFASAGLLERAQFINLTATNDLIVAGTIQDGNNENVIVLKYSNTGNLQWTKTFDFKGGDEKLNDFLIDKADNVYFTGQSQAAPNADDYDAFICRLNADGQQFWVKYIDNQGAGADEGIALSITADNKIYVTGHIDANPSAGEDFDVFLAQYDETGNNLNTATYVYKTAGSDEADDIVLANNDLPCLLTHSNSAGNADIDFSMKLLLPENGSLKEAYSRAVSDSIDVGNTLVWNSSQNALYIGGSTWSQSSQRDIMIGKYQLSSVDLSDIRNEAFKIYPNPAGDYFSINGHSDALKSICISDLNGKIVQCEKNYRLNNTITVNCRNWANGIYIVTLEQAKNTTHFKLIKH
jgi:uncharacterized delta-60 repeat protein